MKLKAKYTIEIHNRSGAYRSEGFIGTRREANTRGMEMVEKNDAGKAIEGFRVHFHRFTEDRQ